MLVYTLPSHGTSGGRKWTAPITRRHGARYTRRGKVRAILWLVESLSRRGSAFSLFCFVSNSGEPGHDCHEAREASRCPLAHGNFSGLARSSWARRGPRGGRTDGAPLCGLDVQNAHENPSCGSLCIWVVVSAYSCTAWLTAGLPIDGPRTCSH